jgi:hypothetical protein
MSKEVSNCRPRIDFAIPISWSEKLVRPIARVGKKSLCCGYTINLGSLAPVHYPSAASSFRLVHQISATIQVSARYHVIFHHRVDTVAHLGAYNPIILL